MANDAAIESGRAARPEFARGCPVDAPYHPGCLAGAAVLALLGYWICPSLSLAGWLVAALLLLLTVLVLDVVMSQRGTRRDGLVGQEAVVVDPLDPAGMVRIQGELWRARVGSGGRVEAGTRVRIRARDGLWLLVEPLNEQLRESTTGQQA